MLAATLDTTPITLIGHPFAPIGMGEQLRSHVAALNAMQLHHRVYDIFRYASRADAEHRALIDPLECAKVPGGIRIFHINGDEIENVVATFERRGNSFAGGANIIVPAWELPIYPQEWAARLARFDEVWALSRFVANSLAASGVTSHLIGQSVELPHGALLPRRHFGLRESAFILLNFFDLSSYATRKNPDGMLDLFERLRRPDPFLDIQLVLKAKNADRDAAEWAARLPAGPQVKVIAEPLDSLGVRSLINASDCFVSLHRSEGFGRGLGEAMFLGRLAMGTGWSGNLDFMTAENSLLVDHRLVPLGEADYPHWHGQSWAEPDIDHAERLLRPVLADPARGRAISRRGQASILRSHSHRAVGLAALARLEAIAAERGETGRATAATRKQAAPRRRGGGRAAAE